MIPASTDQIEDYAICRDDDYMELVSEEEEEGEIVDDAEKSVGRDKSATNTDVSREERKRKAISNTREKEMSGVQTVKKARESVKSPELMNANKINNNRSIPSLTAHPTVSFSSKNVEDSADIIPLYYDVQIPRISELRENSHRSGQYCKEQMTELMPIQGHMQMANLPNFSDLDDAYACQSGHSALPISGFSHDQINHRGFGITPTPLAAASNYSDFGRELCELKYDWEHRATKRPRKSNLLPPPSILIPPPPPNPITSQQHPPPHCKQSVSALNKLLGIPAENELWIQYLMNLSDDPDMNINSNSPQRVVVYYNPNTMEMSTTLPTVAALGEGKLSIISQDRLMLALNQLPLRSDCQPSQLEILRNKPRILICRLPPTNYQSLSKFRSNLEADIKKHIQHHDVTIKYFAHPALDKVELGQFVVLIFDGPSRACSTAFNYLASKKDVSFNDRLIFCIRMPRKIETRKEGSSSNIMMQAGNAIQHLIPPLSKNHIEARELIYLTGANKTSDDTSHKNERIEENKPVSMPASHSSDGTSTSKAPSQTPPPNSIESTSNSTPHQTLPPPPPPPSLIPPTRTGHSEACVKSQHQESSNSHKPSPVRHGVREESNMAQTLKTLFNVPIEKELWIPIKPITSSSHPSSSSNVIQMHYNANTLAFSKAPLDLNKCVIIESEKLISALYETSGYPFADKPHLVFVARLPWNVHSGKPPSAEQVTDFFARQSREQGHKAGIAGCIFPRLANSNTKGFKTFRQFAFLAIDGPSDDCFKFKRYLCRKKDLFFTNCRNFLICLEVPAYLLPKSSKITSRSESNTIGSDKIESIDSTTTKKEPLPGSLFNQPKTTKTRIALKISWPENLNAEPLQLTDVKKLLNSVVKMTDDMEIETMSNFITVQINTERDAYKLVEKLDQTYFSGRKLYVTCNRSLQLNKKDKQTFLRITWPKHPTLHTLQPSFVRSLITNRVNDVSVTNIWPHESHVIVQIDSSEGAQKVVEKLHRININDRKLFITYEGETGDGNQQSHRNPDGHTQIPSPSISSTTSHQKSITNFVPDDPATATFTSYRSLSEMNPESHSPKICIGNEPTSSEDINNKLAFSLEQNHDRNSPDIVIISPSHSRQEQQSKFDQQQFQTQVPINLEQTTTTVKPSTINNKQIENPDKNHAKNNTQAETNTSTQYIQAFISALILELKQRGELTEAHSMRYIATELKTIIELSLEKWSEASVPTYNILAELNKEFMKAPEQKLRTYLVVQQQIVELCKWLVRREFLSKVSSDKAEIISERTNDPCRKNELSLFVLPPKDPLLVNLEEEMVISQEKIQPELQKELLSHKSPTHQVRQQHLNFGIANQGEQPDHIEDQLFSVKQELS